jgi:hypothetical protein
VEAIEACSEKKGEELCEILRNELKLVNVEREGPWRGKGGGALN